MKYLCPKCKDHPVLMKNLDCYFCKGRFVWEELIDNRKCNSVEEEAP